MLKQMLAGGFAAAFFTTVAPAVAQDGDVLAPARAGQLQCYEPNVAAKTCQSISGFSPGPEGAIINTADVLINPAPVIVMRVISPVTIRNGAICGPLTNEDLNRAHFTIDGQRASDADTQQIRTAMTEQLAPLIGQESCITLTPVDGGLRADTAIAGRARPDLAQRVIWVRADEGYRVAP